MLFQTRMTFLRVSKWQSYPFNSTVDTNTERHLRNSLSWRNRCVYHVCRWSSKDKQTFSCFSLHAWEPTVRVKREAVISGRAVNARLRQYGINQLSHKTKWTADAWAAHFQLPQRPPAPQGSLTHSLYKRFTQSQDFTVPIKRYILTNAATEISHHSYQKGWAGFSFQDKHLNKWFGFNNVGRLCLSPRFKC